MSRLIRDEIVMKSVKPEDREAIYDEYSQYAGEVITKLDKVKLQRISLGTKRVSVIDSLQSLYRSCSVQEDKCYLEISGISKKEVKPKVYKMLQALLFEQVNNNLEYCQVIASIYKRLALQVIKDIEPFSFEEVNNLTSMQKVVYDSVTEYIVKELND